MLSIVENTKMEYKNSLLDVSIAIPACKVAAILIYHAGFLLIIITIMATKIANSKTNPITAPATLPPLQQKSKVTLHSLNACNAVI